MNRFVLFLFALFSCASFARAEELPILKATVGTPVVPELMGGCSMKCAFPWTVEARPAQAAKSAPVTTLNDNQPSPPWTNAHAIGTKITFFFPTKLPSVMEDNVPFYGFDVINGDWTNEETWKNAARVKKARFWYNGKALYTVLFADTRHWQHFSFDDIMVHSGDRMTLEILEIYPGAKAGPLAISEVVLQGAH